MRQPIQTAGNMAPSIGTVGTVEMEGMRIQVRVVDMRQRWNVVDALVEPLAGTGRKWIEARRVCVSDETAIMSR
jgi:hypothetical protein